MKANRKFLQSDDDEAVSPVIAVILMVAITVVLAATVYVWVSGFGNSSSTPAKTLSLTSAGQESADTTDPLNTKYAKTYTVASASTGLTYQDMRFQVAGADYAFSSGAAADADKEWSAKRGAADLGSTDAVRAGDVLTLFSEQAGAGSQVGKTLQILDPNANSIMLTLTVAS